VIIYDIQYCKTLKQSGPPILFIRVEQSDAPVSGGHHNNLHMAADQPSLQM
jgi:hypothetical protein